MDARFQPSFIPKQPMGSIVSRGISAHISLFYVGASIIFIITVGLIGASLIAENSLNKDITILNQDLITAKSSFEISTIEELKRISAKTSIAQGLLEKHIAVSKFLEIIGDYTYANVSFSGLSVSMENNTTVISLTGVAGSYNTLILQSDLFEELTFFRTSAFSGFSINENGSVSFSFSAIVDPSLIDYKRYITGE